MDIHTLDRGFAKQDTIDEFESAIWTERYYGDGDFELSVPANDSMMSKLPKGQLMMCAGSQEPMILETRDIKDGLMKTTGITLTQWLNNRTIRTSADHAVKEWNISRFRDWGPPPVTSGLKPGEVIAYIVEQFCIDGPFLDGTVPIGIPVAQTTLFKIPGLVIGARDDSGIITDYSIPFGPVYDSLKQIATTYEIGMKILLDSVTELDYQISFHSYKGVDRTSNQSVNPVIRFSPEMDSFTNINDLESITDHKNYVFVFAPTADPALITDAGFASSLPTGGEGFDLRVFQGFLDSLPSDLDSTALTNILNQTAQSEIRNQKVVQLVDGEIVQVQDVVYGTNFFLGDIVEVEGNTGVRQTARITEYIRSQDQAGERAYPTLSMID